MPVLRFLPGLRCTCSCGLLRCRAGGPAARVVPHVIEVTCFGGCLRLLEGSLPYASKGVRQSVLARQRVAGMLNGSPLVPQPSDAQVHNCRALTRGAQTSYSRLLAEAVEQLMPVALNTLLWALWDLQLRSLAKGCKRSRARPQRQGVAGSLSRRPSSSPWSRGTAARRTAHAAGPGVVGELRS